MNLELLGLKARELECSW